MSILVTGGAGYIGSVTADLLVRRRERVVVLDDLSRGHRSAVPEGVVLCAARAGDAVAVMRIIREQRVDACVHFAAFAYVGESVSDPALYFENNVAETGRLLKALVETGVTKIVFSSTCSTYGEPEFLPISEDHPQRPTNPYGWTKLMVEQMLKECDRAYGLKSVALRYFNAAGATEPFGEHHDPEPHLIPNVLAATERRLPHVCVYGADYPTPDGTAIRDYVHVSDLAVAHAVALDYLRDGGASERVNIGTGLGSSVLDIVHAAERVSSRPVRVRMAGRRNGDPSHLVAAADKAARVLNWRPTHSNLDEIVRSAWAWRQAHPAGYVF